MAEVNTQFKRYTGCETLSQNEQRGAEDDEGRRGEAEKGYGTTTWTIDQPLGSYTAFFALYILSRGKRVVSMAVRAALRRFYPPA